MPVPTPRLLIISLAGLIAITVAGSYIAALTIAATWLVAGALLACIDAFSVPARDRLRWSREHEDKLSIGQSNPVTVKLSNRTRRRLVVRARDAAPWQLSAENPAGGGQCQASGDWEFSYRLFPVHRGHYELGPLTVRVLGPLGLAWKQYTIPLVEPVKVYPDLLAIRSYDALLHRAQLQEMGLRITRQRGTGTEFERLRDYTPDDEYRRINWPATARRHAPVAIDYETDRNQNIFVLLDTGRLMGTRLPLPDDISQHSRVQALTRLDYAINATLLLSYASLQHDDRTGLVAFSDRVTRFIPPGRGRRHFLTLVEAMYDLQPDRTEVDFGAALGHVAARATRRSLIVLFTDADGADTNLLVSQLTHLARRHLVLLATLRDPAIERLANLAPVDSDAVYDRSVAMELLQERKRVARDLQHRGVLTLDVSADQLTPALLNRYLQIKAQSRL